MSPLMRSYATRTVSLALLGMTLIACGSPSMQEASAPKEQIDGLNAVDRLGVPVNFSYDPDVFPSQSRSNRAVWSGNWWPLSQGGTANAMGKYDAAQGQGSQARDWEMDTVSRSGGVSWAGHCNGLAAAGINESEPKRDVQYRGQTFTVSDIQALLVEKWQGVRRIELVGRRCSGNVSTDADGRITDAGCRDINPAAFHIVLGNMLGLKKEPFIVDISTGDEVWNYPAVAYTSNVSGLDRAEAARLVSSGSNGNYSWNPQADQFMLVKTQIQLASGSTMTLDYVLEGRNDRIIGGEWIGSSKEHHPDFVWTTSTPDPVNPNLDINVIDTIARMSR